MDGIGCRRAEKRTLTGCCDLKIEEDDWWSLDGGRPDSNLSRRRVPGQTHSVEAASLDGLWLSCSTPKRRPRSGKITNYQQLPTFGTSMSLSNGSRNYLKRPELHELRWTIHGGCLHRAAN